MDELRKKKEHLEKEVTRLSTLLKKSERNNNKQKMVYNKNMENLGLKMIEFEKSLLQEQATIKKLLQNKDKDIKSKDEKLDELQHIINEIQCETCGCTKEQNDESTDVEIPIDNIDEESIRTLPPLSLPVTSALPNVSFNRPFRRKSKLSPVAEEAELSFSSNLRHVHADTNPEKFHALLTSRLLGSDVDEPYRNDVTPVAEASDKHTYMLADVNSNHAGAESPTKTVVVNDLNAFSNHLSDTIISIALSSTDGLMNDNQKPNHELRNHKLLSDDDLEKESSKLNHAIENFSNDLANKTILSFKDDFQNYKEVNNIEKINKNENLTNKIELEMHDKACELLVNNILQDAQITLLAQSQSNSRSNSADVIIVSNQNEQTESESSLTPTESDGKDKNTIISTQESSTESDGKTTEDNVSSDKESTSIGGSLRIDNTEEVKNENLKENEINENINTVNEQNTTITSIDKKPSRETRDSSIPTEVTKLPINQGNLIASAVPADLHNANNDFTSSSSFDEAADKEKQDKDTAASTKSKKKKKKKKKKRKSSTGNDISTSSNDTSSSPSAISPELSRSHDSQQKANVETLKAIDEDKFSILVDESLNMLDNLSDDHLIQSCSFEDLSIIMDKTSSKPAVDVSEYEVLS